MSGSPSVRFQHRFLLIIRTLWASVFRVWRKSMYEIVLGLLDVQIQVCFVDPAFDFGEKRSRLGSSNFPRSLRYSFGTLPAPLRSGLQILADSDLH